MSPTNDFPVAPIANRPRSASREMKFADNADAIARASYAFWLVTRNLLEAEMDLSNRDSDGPAGPSSGKLMEILIDCDRQGAGGAGCRLTTPVLVFCGSSRRDKKFGGVIIKRLRPSQTFENHPA